MLDEVTRRLVAEGYGDTRFADGVLIQHLIEGSRTPTDLASRERGHAVVAASRRHRAAVCDEVARAVGVERADQAQRLLTDVLTHLGAEPALRSRRVRPPT